MRAGLKTLLVCCLFVSGPALAQNTQTLADIRTELGALYGQIQELRQELAVTGDSGNSGASAQGPALLRIDAIENEMRRITGLVEELQFRVNSVVKDGTNRVGDLEFRLCELEEACDVMKLGQTPTLGGGEVAAAPQPASSTGSQTAGMELAVAEKSDFDAAYAAYQSGRHLDAADKFLAFSQTYPGGPLMGNALHWRGEALVELGDWKSAARSFLDGFSGAPNGEMAARSLYRLGNSLEKLGKVEQACQTLAEVGNRYPNAPERLDAANDMQNMGCS